MLLREQVHVTAIAAAQTVDRSHALFDDGGRVHAAQDHAGSAAMVQGNGVAVSQMVEHTGVDALLTDSKMHLAGNASFVPETGDRLLDPPAGQHLAIQRHAIRFHIPSQFISSRPAGKGFSGASR
ncbi:conserved hypothetical protein [delta proteobacterium NaphS2]|nr:conserved hypothetical protein [delta proteobacterium NaphS2]